MMPHVNSIHDEFCRCRDCKPPKLPDRDLHDAIGQPLWQLQSQIDPRAEIARDRLAMGAMGLVAVVALGLHWAGLA
jgi:hypothetical protein